MKNLLTTLALTSLAPLAAHAQGQAEAGFAPTAQAGGGFGAQGQIVLSLGATGDEPFMFHKSGGAWELQLAPSGDYFVAPRVSVGGVLAYGHVGGGSGANGNGVDTFSVAPRAGYAFDFDDRFGVWPLAGLRLDVASVNHDTSTNTYFTAYVPFLFHPVQHFFVGLGPSAAVHLSGGNDSSWGVDSMLGGWF